MLLIINIAAEMSFISF